jgi:hypothetical protein
MNPLDSVWYAATWHKDVMTTHLQDIHAANHITRRGLPAYPTCLRGIRFVNLHGATGFVIQLANQPSITGTAHLLGLASSDLLCRVIKRLPDVTGGARERLSHFARGFVHHIAHTAMRLRQHVCFAPLQTLPLPGALRLRALGLATRCQAFVAVLHGGFCRSATDQEGVLSVCGRQQGIDPQVNTNDALLWSGHVGNLTDQTDCRYTQPHFHQASRHRDSDGYTQPATRSMGQEQPLMTQPCILVGIHDIAVSGLLPRIARFVMAVFAELSGAVHGLAELTNDLLGTLGTERLSGNSSWKNSRFIR